MNEQIPMIVKANTPLPAYHFTIADVEPDIGDNTDEVITCALCPRRIWFRDSYSPGDDAICAECDTEVTGRVHPPSLPVPWGEVLKGAFEYPYPPPNNVEITGVTVHNTGDAYCEPAVPGAEETIIHSAGECALHDLGKQEQLARAYNARHPRLLALACWLNWEWLRKLVV